ncbi:hypothetical protein [Spirosoma fluminis]
MAGTYTQYYVGRRDPANPSQPLRDAQGRRVLWIAPMGYVPLIGQVVDPQAEGWSRYYGPENVLSSECASGPTPEAGAPVWTNVSPPGFRPGKYWEWIIPLDAATPAAGQTIVDYAEQTLPQYLKGIHAGPNVKIYGTIPEDAVPVFSVYALQSDGKNTPQTFTLQALSADVYMYYRYYAAQNKIVVREGGDDRSLPSVQMSGPASWTDNGSYQMYRFGAIVNGVDYFFAWDYLNPQSGLYQIRTEHLGVTLYGQVPINAALDSEGVVQLTLESPGTVLPTTDWVADDTNGPDLIPLPTTHGNLRWAGLPYQVTEGGPALKVIVEEQQPDGSWQVYANPPLSAPSAPAGIGFITPVPGEFKANNGTTNNTFTQPIRATIGEDVLEVGVQVINALDPTPTTNKINEVTAYLIQGWRTVRSNGTVEESCWVFARVTGNVIPEIKYVQSRNPSGAVYAQMQVLPANSPFAAAGHTHFATYYDEQLSGRENPFNQFLLRLPNVSNSEVLGTFNVSASYPDGTAAQIYPQTN